MAIWGWDLDRLRRGLIADRGGSGAVRGSTSDYARDSGDPLSIGRLGKCGYRTRAGDCLLGSSCACRGSLNVPLE